MAATNARSIALGTAAYVVASFLVQATSHFVIAADHFASISFARTEPIMALGVGVMLVQGLVLSAVFGRLARPGSVMRDGLWFALAMGLFLGSYIAVVEPSKYVVPSIASWVGVEGVAALVQFSLFGLGLGLAFRGTAVVSSSD